MPVGPSPAQGVIVGSGMVFTNPWGLLALLSTAAIVGLHFFRSHRQARVIGGLHLWQFAATRRPAGSRWARLVRSASLGCQLLAATCLSLLMAGADIPRRESAAHYTVLLDDSVSMNARGTDSAVERARQALAQWADAGSRFTVLAAGARARVLAGPYAERSEMLDALHRWQPGAPSCDLAQGVQLAARFVAGDEKILFVTDQPDQGRDHAHLLETLGVGQTLPNNAIVFADRVRAAPDRDRIVVTLRTFGPAPVTCRVEARANGRVLYASVPPRRLTPDEPDGFSFQTDLLDATIEIALEPDALAADNHVRLSPVPVRPMRVHTALMDPLKRYLVRAVEATPYAFMEPDPHLADVVFAPLDAFPALRHPAGAPEVRTQDPADAPPVVPAALLASHASAVLFCVLPRPDGATVAGVAGGLEMVADSQALITQGLPLEEGLLWPFVAASVPRPFVPLLHSLDAPLLFGGPLDTVRPRRVECYFLNLVHDRTNVYQTSAWPVLVRNVIEQARRIVPGMQRTNYRLGEQIHVALDPGRIGDQTAVDLWRDGVRYERYHDAHSLPRVLDHLEAGGYRFVAADDTPLASFSVNLFAPGESDLTGAQTTRADLAQLQPGRVAGETGDERLALILSLLVVCFTGLSWVFQDTSR